MGNASRKRGAINQKRCYDVLVVDAYSRVLLIYPNMISNPGLIPNVSLCLLM